MEADATCTKLPSRVKPYKPPSTEGEELDEIWSLTKEANYSIVLNFGKGTAKRRALELLHWHLAREQNGIIVESTQEKVAALETASRRSTFAESYKEALAKHTSTTGSTTL